MAPGLKLAIIGGGSSYTPELVDGLIRNHELLPLREVVLADVQAGLDKVQIITGLVGRMFARAGLDPEVRWTLDRRDAIRDADFVITQFRVGGLEARARDERIPLAHGIIGQETTGPGGFAKALRTIPVALGVARDVEELAPVAWILNFANPSGIVTEAILTHSRARCIGLCNVPLTMHRLVAAAIGADPVRLRCEFTGLNHLSWLRRIELDGADITGDIVARIAGKAGSRETLAGIPGGEWLAMVAPLVPALNMIPSPYLRYYYFPSEMVREEQDAIARGEGTRADQVMAVEKELFAQYRAPDLGEKPALLGERGGLWYSDAAVAVMSAIRGNRGQSHVVNVHNGVAIPDLPPEAVIETNCRVDRDGAHPEATGERLPLSIRGLVQQVKAYEQLTVEAAVTGCRRTALHALLNHPLVPGYQVARALLDDILGENLEYLPQFARNGG